MALLGEDGRGYELALKLDSCGVWRSWLGDPSYSNFVSSLSSPNSWHSFMNPDASKTRAQIHLQLRARALLYDKATLSLFFRSLPSSSSSSSAAAAAPSKLTSSYLQLHGDDVYFSLEDDSFDGVLLREGSTAANSVQYKATKLQSRLASFDQASSIGARYSDPEVDNVSQRSIHDKLPETWYNQYIEKYRTSRQHRSVFADRESHKRTPEGMSAYLRFLENHKRRRQAFKEDHYAGFAKPLWDDGSHTHTITFSDVNNSTEDETCFFPEIMFPSNCVPDSALPPTNRPEDSQKVEFYGVLDNLPPHVISRSPAMIERFGIRPEYLKMGLGGSKFRGKNGTEGNKKPLSHEQASQMTQKVIARVLANVGIEGSTEASMKVLSQFLECHICKLGRTLKLLADSYRKQCSALELLKMFLQTAGYSNLGALAEHMKDGAKVFPNQTQHQQARGFQSQQPLLQAQQVQQVQRQMHPQMHMLHPQNLALQQLQWDKMRRQQASTPRSSNMTPEKERSMVQVKIENISEPSIDSTFSGVNKQQMQYRNQQMAMGNHHAQPGHQYKQLSSLQIPQLQTQSMFSVRAQPVKVEGFQELMGGDATSKHESEEHKLTSPSK